MVAAILSSKGQLTIPKQVRLDLGLNVGDRVEFVQVQPGRYEILAVTHDVSELKGIVKKPKKPVSIEKMKKTISEMGK